MSAPEIVRIEWLDSSQAVPGWQWLSELETPGAIRCVSVGFLVRDNSEEKALAISIGEADSEHNAQASGIISIPTRCVVRMDRLLTSCDPGAAIAANE